MEKFNKIAIIGGTGKAGKFLVKHLVNQGFTIKVLLRNPDKLKISSPLIEKVTGDVTDYETVFSLIDGCNAVISALGQSKGEKPVHSVSSSNIIRAMNSFNIRRYIVITGLTIDTPFDRKSFKTKLLSKIMKLSYSAVIADKQREYSIISESNLDWTIVRLPLIEPSETSGAIKVSLTDCPGRKISTTDLAVFLIKQLSNESYIKKSPFISN
ncbi:MAG TPA: SDR family oxidoreductase [Bacteroidales bacterium]|nr:SDR family oxidoreductase [Bacteroidales bacterium]HRZ49134.1 SDR family oxidoreductase [Bacteroidales bacterium]